LGPGRGGSEKSLGDKANPKQSGIKYLKKNQARNFFILYVFIFIGFRIHIILYESWKPMKIGKAQTDEAHDILKLQRIAYQSEAELHNDFTIPPLTQTLEEIKADFARQLFLKAVIGDTIIGSVRARDDGGNCYVGRLIVHPDFQNQGIGARLLNEIEIIFKDSKRYELFTGHRSGRNLYFYQKFGYKIFKTEKIHDNLSLVYLEKLNRG
jgi:ribosomal protein S18 acetylase RimI-like enzyme